MGWFRRRQDPARDPEDLIVQVFAEEGITGEVLPEGALRTPDGAVYGFAGIAERLRDLPPAEHAAAVRAHVALLRARVDDGGPRTVADAPDTTLLRIHHRDAVPPESLVHARPLLDPLYVLPAVDLPDVVSTIMDPDAFGGWDAIWPVAMANLRALPLPDHQTLAEGAVHVFLTDDFFGATRLLDVDRLLDEVGAPPAPRHLLVTVPNRHVLAVVVLQPDDPHAALEVLAQIGHGELDRPGALIPDVLYRGPDGLLQRISSTREDGTVDVVVEGAFADALEELGLIQQG